MTIRRSCSWVVTLGLAAIIVAADAAPARPASSAGTVRSHTEKAAPRVSKPPRLNKAVPDQSTHHPGSSDAPAMPAPPDPTRTIEERLRRGQMEKPVVQGQISERLEQFYKGPENGTGNPAQGLSSSR